MLKEEQQAMLKEDQQAIPKEALLIGPRSIITRSIAQEEWHKTQHPRSIAQEE
jgi:hypothetical protein